MKRESWTLKKCIEIAKKHDNLHQWLHAPGMKESYNTARRNGWLLECSMHLRVKKVKWTQSLLITDARKYNTITDWTNHSPAAQSFACKRKDIYKKCTAHMANLHQAWTAETCLVEAKKYNLISLWQEKGRGSYRWAKRNGCLDLCTKHMIRRDDATRIKLVNDLGQTSTPSYRFVSFEGMNKYRNFLVKIQNLEYKNNFEIIPISTLKQGKNPWSNKFPDDLVKKQINKIGRNSTPPYRFVSVIAQHPSGRKIIKIQNTETLKIALANFSVLKKGSNPWRPKGLSKDAIESRVNRLGNTASPNYKFVTTFFKDSVRYVKIQNLETNKYTSSRLSSLTKGSNPWNNTQDRDECKIVQPKVASALRKMGLVVEKEVLISKQSRVDFVATNKDKRKIIIEVKSEKRSWSKNSLLNQKKRYMRDGKKKYGNHYARTYLVSLKGTYGYSLAQLSKVLKSDGLI